MTTIRALADRFNLNLLDTADALALWTRAVGPDAELTPGGESIVRGVLASVRLEQLRAVIDAESISQGEILELQGYGEAGYIDPGDVQLREWAGLPEHDDDKVDTSCKHCGAAGHTADDDTVSTVSRQYFIDTGRYLTHAEVAETLDSGLV